VNNSPVNYIDILGLWDFHGNGTATAQSGDTLWGLAQQVSGNGFNWTKITGYNGIPEQMQVGQTVNYIGMTTIVPTNAYIVANSGHSEASTREQFSNATKIFNSQGIPITFQLNIQTIDALSTAGIDLWTIQVGDATQNIALANSIGNGIISTSGETVSFFDTTGRSFNYLFTNALSDGSYGISYQGTTTSVISAQMAYNSTTHETGHVLNIMDILSVSNNLMGLLDSSLLGTPAFGHNTYLSPDQIRRANEYLESYPNQSNYRNVLPQRGGKGE
jgi:hypothetical protein